MPEMVAPVPYLAGRDGPKFVYGAHDQLLPLGLDLSYRDSEN